MGAMCPPRGILTPFRRCMGGAGNAAVKTDTASVLGKTLNGHCLLARGGRGEKLIAPSTGARGGRGGRLPTGSGPWGPWGEDTQWTSRTGMWDGPRDLVLDGHRDLVRSRPSSSRRARLVDGVQDAVEDYGMKIMVAVVIAVWIVIIWSKLSSKNKISSKKKSRQKSSRTKSRRKSSKKGKHAIK